MCRGCAEQSGRGEQPDGSPTCTWSGPSLSEAHLEGANLRGAHLERANLTEAHLEGAASPGRTWSGPTSPRRAWRRPASAARSGLGVAHLEGARLVGAHLERAYLGAAHLEQSRALGAAHLEGADLSSSLAGQDHPGLNGAVLTGVSLDQITFDNANLTVVNMGRRRRRCRRRAVRVCRQRCSRPACRRAARLASLTSRPDHARQWRARRALRAQGMTDDADIFAYRAQVLQRQLVLPQAASLGRWLFSRLLATLSGYGYHLGNIFRAYALVVLVFAVGYLDPDFRQRRCSRPARMRRMRCRSASTPSTGASSSPQFTLDTLRYLARPPPSRVVGIVIEGVLQPPCSMPAPLPLAARQVARTWCPSPSRSIPVALPAMMPFYN